jgi:2-amino-4-hydroxy-6-hydroxymethyldihydropteridine diphosphokinase
VEPEALLVGRGSVAAILGDLTREGVSPRADLELHLPE